MARIIVRIEVTPKAKQALESLMEKHGMTQVALCSRLLEWLGEQPSVVRSSIVSELGAKANPDTAKLILQNMVSAAGK